MTRRAWCLIRDQPVYRRDAFVNGLRRAGFDICHDGASRLNANPGDVLVMWNRYGENHHMALQFEARGGQVLVAENGYVGNDRRDRTIYAIACRGHNGSGHWSIGGPERWNALGVSIKPWRTDGTHVLVCPNRSFGMPGFIMPPNWVEETRDKLMSLTRRPVRVRPHPGNDPARKPLAEDLADAWACVIWSSSAGCEALLAGIPVFSLAPWWICSSASVRDLALINKPPIENLDRQLSFERLAWAQWHIKEIESGESFSYLCDRTSAFADSV